MTLYNTYYIINIIIYLYNKTSICIIYPCKFTHIHTNIYTNICKFIHLVYIINNIIIHFISYHLLNIRSYSPRPREYHKYTLMYTTCLLQVTPHFSKHDFQLWMFEMFLITFALMLPLPFGNIS